MKKVKVSWTDGTFVYCNEQQAYEYMSDENYLSTRDSNYIQSAMETTKAVVQNLNCEIAQYEKDLKELGSN